MAAEPRWFDERIETMEREEIRSMQLSLLAEQLTRLGATCPAYRRRLRGWPRRFTSYRDLAGLEPMDRADLQAGDPQGGSGRGGEPDVGQRPDRVGPRLGPYAVAPPEKITRVYSTSGTTGAFALVGLTAADRRAWEEVGARVLYCAGLRRTDLVATTLSLGLFSGGLPTLGALDRIGVGVVPVGPVSPDVVAQVLRRLGVTFLICSTSYALYLAEYLSAAPNPALSAASTSADGRWSLDTVMVGTEPGGALPHLAARLGAAYGARITEGLGASELMPLYAGMCGVRPGMHLLAPDHLLVEILDDDGEQVSWQEGAEGEVVATHLRRECSPLVRYRTGDRVRIEGMDCPCGRTGARITCRGRIAEAIATPTGSAFPADFLDLVAEFHPRAAGPFELVADGEEAKVRVEYGVGVTDLVALEADLGASMRQRFGREFPLDFAPPGTLSRFDRKARYLRGR